jgi:outer membrane protein OmpA-like peptidoglycan-associated protein
MHDGCPNKDTDKDGIPSPQDKCPDQPETVNGFEDDDGCPDKKPLVQLKETEVQINERINFDKGKAVIEPASMPVVDAVAEVLKQNPELGLIEVAGHASKEGDEKKNVKLTQERVERRQGAREEGRREGPHAAAGLRRVLPDRQG